MTCDQRRTTDTIIIGVSNTSATLGNSFTTAYAIKTASSGALVANPTTVANLEAFSSLTFRANFKTQVQTSGGLFRAYLKPTAMGCAVGGNALVVQTATFNCPGNASANRLASFTNQNDDQGMLEMQNQTGELQEVHFKIAPNPNTAQFKLLFNQKVKAGTVVVYNGMGQKVFETQLEGDNDTYKLDMEEFLTAAGIYYLSWTNAAFTMRQKFTVY